MLSAAMTNESCGPRPIKANPAAGRNPSGGRGGRGEAMSFKAPLIEGKSAALLRFCLLVSICGQVRAILRYVWAARSLPSKFLSSHSHHSP